MSTTIPEVEEPTVDPMAQEARDYLDAQYEAEHPAKEEDSQPAAEAGSGETPVESTPAEHSPAAESTTNWFDDAEVKETAELYGIPPEQLALIGDKDAFERFNAIYAQRMVAMGSRLLGEQEPKHEPTPAPSSQPQTPRQAPAPEPAQPAPTPPVVAEVLAQVAKLNPQDYDENVVNALSGMAQLVNQQQSAIGELVQYVQQQVQQQQQALLQQQWQHQLDQVNTLISSLGHNELFGDDSSAKPEHWQNREQVIRTLVPLQHALTQGGTVPPITKALVRQAVNAAFHDKLIEQARQEQTEKLRHQSSKRLGGGTSRLTKQPTRPLPKSGDLTDDPQFMDGILNILNRAPSED